MTYNWYFTSQSFSLKVLIKFEIVYYKKKENN